MRQIRLFITLAMLCLVALFLPLQAGIKDRPYSLHFSFGGAQPALNDSTQIWLISPIVSGHIQYMLSPQTGVILAAGYSAIYNDSINASVLRLDIARANRIWTTTSVSLGPKFYLHRRKGMTPYIALTADLVVWKIANRTDHRPVLVLEKSDAVVDYSAWELGATAGFGFEKLFGNRIGLAVEADLTYLTGVNTNFAQSVIHARSRALFRIMAGLSVNFGGKPRSLLKEFEGRDKFEPPPYARRVYQAEIDRLTGDTVFVDQSRSFAGEGFMPVGSGQSPPQDDVDLDGVDDKLDKCPDTPAGALVDVDGCPHDADGDGFYDGIDTCPDTPRQARGLLDEFGCPLDTDADGMPDYLDRCAETPPEVAVDSSGCPLDSDRDGVIDALDRCPDTPRRLPIDNYGCPDVPALSYTRILRATSTGGEISKIAEARGTLDSIADLMKTFREVTATISGFTADEGSAATNLQTSQERADVIKKYLVLQGVDAARLQTVGEGEAHSIDTNRTTAGRERNRRIEIEFHYP
ncbi:MAG: OmpA family protein [Candidatus Zixiibacteriota bacterium]|nr:MAG: OmpA family protein [candidate division Zixibacteria bacterium]